MDTKLYQDKEWITTQYCEKGLTSTEMGRLLGCSGSTIIRWMKRYGICSRTASEAKKLCWDNHTYDARKKGGVRRGRIEVACAICGKKFAVSPSQVTRRRCCSRECYGRFRSETMSKENHSQWKGGIPSVKKTCETCGKEFFTYPSAVRRGRRYCSLECHIKSGKGNPNWRGGVSFEPYPTTFNEQFKQMIRERDNHTCAICGKQPARDVHHINYVKENTVPENCITLCHSCHTKTSNGDRERYEKELSGIIAQRMAVESDVTV